MGASGQMKEDEELVDELDPHERDEDAAEPIDEEVPAKEQRRSDRSVLNAAERERDEEDDYDRIEDDGRENRAVGGREVHHVEPREGGVRRDERGRDDG